MLPHTTKWRRGRFRSSKATARPVNQAAKGYACAGPHPNCICWQGASTSEACRIAALSYGFCVQSPRPARRPASPTAPARLPLAHKAVIEHRPLWRLNWHNQGWRQHCALLPASRASRALYLYLRLQTAEASSSGHPLLEGEGTRLRGVGHAACCVRARKKKKY